jgi:hypothetical protein
MPIGRRSALTGAAFIGATLAANMSAAAETVWFGE